MALDNVYVHPQALVESEQIGPQTRVWAFAHVLPGVDVADLPLASVLTVVVVANTALAHWFARLGQTWPLSLRQFAVLGLVNATLAMLAVALRPGLRNMAGLANALFLALLLTLLVTLFDHYRQVYLMRFADKPERAAGSVTP